MYLTGSFSGNAYFDTTPANAVDSEDFFIVKYRSEGIFLWVRNGGGAGIDSGSQIEITPENNIVVIGSTSSNSATFYPDVSLIHNNNYRGFLINYNGDNGDIIWLKSIPGSSQMKLNFIGNIYVWAPSLYAKYLANGTFSYQQNFSGTARAMALAGTNHILFTGDFRGVVRIGSSILTCEDEGDIYVSHWVE